MTEISDILPDIPRTLTAVAEWMACMQCISELKRRIKGIRFVVVSAGMLLIQSIFLNLTVGLNNFWWIVCMAAAIMMMYLFIYGCCCVNKRAAGYYCVRALVAAEFSASFGWQIVLFFGAEKNKFSGFFPMILILAAVYILMWAIYKPYTLKEKDDISKKELGSYIIIGAAVFLVSNLGFVTAHTPFSGSYIGEVFRIRTLVDLGGMAILYAYHVQRMELRSRYELEIMQKMLHTQYQQYQQSQELVDLINYKYHDLKHHILVLRQEADTDKQKDYLERMADEIKNYEAQNKTGNEVLDTMLTAKSLRCSKEKISMTCVVDGMVFDFMDAMDICSIFGNALDNAIEYEMKVPDIEKRLIHVTACAQKQLLMIRFENYCEEEVVFDKKMPVTTKADWQFHGFGLKSLRYTVKKYGGETDISLSDNWFSVRILIPLKNKI